MNISRFGLSSVSYIKPHYSLRLASNFDDHISGCAIRSFGEAKKATPFTVEELKLKIKRAEDGFQLLRKLDGHPKLKDSKYCLRHTAEKTVELSKWILDVREKSGNVHFYNRMLSDQLFDVAIWWTCGTDDLRTRAVKVTKKQRVSLNNVGSLIENACKVMDDR